MNGLRLRFVESIFVDLATWREMKRLWDRYVSLGLATDWEREQILAPYIQTIEDKMELVRLGFWEDAARIA